MLTILGDIAQFEREIMLEHEREGTSKAKVEGKYKDNKSLQTHIKKDVIQLVLTETQKQKLLGGSK